MYLRRWQDEVSGVVEGDLAEAAREGGKSLNLSQKSIKTILKALQDKNDGKI